MLKPIHTKTKALMLAGLMGIVMLLTMLSTAEAIELDDAAKDGDIARITALLDAWADPNTRNEYGLTPLHDAARYGTAAAITLLLDAGAHPNARDKWGDTALDLITEDSPIYGTDAYWRLNDAKYNQ